MKKKNIFKSFVGSAVLGALIALIPNARGDDLFDQHRKLMLESITQCKATQVERLLTTPYVDPDDPKGNYIRSSLNLGNCTVPTRIQLLQALFKAGADPNKADTSENPLLLPVARLPSDWLNVMKLFVSNGLNFGKQSATNALNYFSYWSWDGPLDFKGASVETMTEIFDFLASNGVPISTLNKFGQTPLTQISMKWGNAEQANWLLAKGADINSRDYCGEGMSAVDYAQMVQVSGYRYIKLADYPEFRAKNPTIVARADALFTLLQSKGATIRPLPKSVVLECRELLRPLP